MKKLRPPLNRVLLALGLVALAACTGSEEKAAGLAAQAQQMLDAGQPLQAQGLIQAALRERDDLPALYLVQAHVALALGKRGDAYQAYSNVLALEATNPEALLGSAQTGLGSGHLLEADKAADKVLVLDPNQTDAMLVKGIVELVRNDLDGAIDYSSRILALKPDDVGGLILKSRGLALQGKQAEALALIQSAIKRTGETPEMVTSLAELQRVNGDGAAFLSALRRIRTFAPRNRDYRFDLIDTLYRAGNIDEARAEATSLLDEPMTNAAELARFPRLWYAYDREALTPEQIAHVAQKASAEARLALARFFIATGRAPVASALLRPIATGWSSDVQGAYARAGEAMGQVPAARQAADAILQKDGDNGDALLIRANAAMTRGDPKTAIVDYQRVVRDYPQWEEGYLGLVRAYGASNKPMGVRRAFEDARQALPQSLPIARAYTDALVSAGNTAHAVDVARRFALNSPSLGAGWALYTDLCAKSGVADCRGEAAAGAAQAKRRFGLDQPPGTPPPVALIGRLDRPGPTT